MLPEGVRVSLSTRTRSEVDVHGHRKFYDFEFVDENLHHLLATSDLSIDKGSIELINYIRSNIIGYDYKFRGPFGLRKGEVLLNK